MQEKLKAYKNSKCNFLSSCFIADDSYLNIARHVVVFTEHDILIIQWKYLKTVLILTIAPIK